MALMDSLDLDFSESSIDCLPLFLGERGGEGQRAFFRNISDQNFTPENMVKALVQGMINELYRFYETLPEDVHNSIRHLVGAGNGIRKNRHLIKAAELRYNMLLSLLDLKEESCMGALINAGKGSGIFKNYAEGAAAIVKYS
jgi:sedoheptulokinase